MRRLRTPILSRSGTAELASRGCLSASRDGRGGDLRGGFRRPPVAPERGDRSGERFPEDTREAGFTLLALMMMLIVMAIFMGVAVESISFQMRREKEAELIFRGKQYVEAIRLFQKKYGRYPMSLKEIWKAKPRVIRKKWKDPITDSYQWGLVFLGQQGRQVGAGGTPIAGGQGSLPTPTPTPEPEPGEDGEGSGFGGPGGLGGTGGTGARGPIIGVYSRSKEDSIRVYEGRTRYCDWKFTLEDARNGRNRGGNNPRTPWGQVGGGGGGQPVPTNPAGGPGLGGGGRPPIRIPPHRGGHPPQGGGMPR